MRTVSHPLQQTSWSTLKRTAVLTACSSSLSISLTWNSRVFTRETRMELNSCFGQDDASAAFVRDSRIRKISPVNNKLTNQDTTPIVRRRTVITIGSVSELDGSTNQQEEQTISASEVGETACGRISITVKTIPKTPSIRVIREKKPIFSPDLHGEDEWASRKDTVPFKSSSVSDPSWIYVPIKPERSNSAKIIQRHPWHDEKPLNEIDSTLAHNQKLFRTLSNKNSSYTLTEIDMEPSANSRKLKLDEKTNKEFDSAQMKLKPTFKMIFGDETKILRLTDDTSSSEKSMCKLKKSHNGSMARSPIPIGYNEWLKSLDRLEGESYFNQTHSSDDEKVKNRDTKSIKSTPAGTVLKPSDTVQSGLVETSTSHKSILKNVQNESEIRREKIDPIKNQHLKNVTTGIVPEVSLEVHKSTLTKPINSFINTKDIQEWAVKPTVSLAGLVGKSNDTDSKFNKIIPTNGKQVAVGPENVDCTHNRLPVAIKVDGVDSMEVVNKNQINSIRSLSSSGSWKKNSNTQDGINGPVLSSGMDISKATELVKQFFNTGNREDDPDNHENAVLVTDKMHSFNVTKSNSLAEDQTLSISHGYQTAATQPTLNGSIEFGHHRGRSAIKSKIPLRIPRTTSNKACSHSSNISTLTTPAVAYVDKGNHIPAPKNYAFNKAKSTINMSSKIKPPLTGSTVRTRSVENLRQTSPLSSYVLYSNIMTARDEVNSHYQ